jgi:hypothetical protein
MNTLKKFSNRMCLTQVRAFYKTSLFSFSDNKFKDKESTEERVFIDKEESRDFIILKES